MTTKRIRIIGIAGAVVLIALGAVLYVALRGGPAQQSHTGGKTAAAGGGPPVPSSGAYLGASVWPSDYSQAGRVDAMQSFRSAAGGRLAIAHVYVQFGTPLATASTLQFVRDGQHLLVSWAISDMPAAASGHLDGDIRSMAQQVAALGVPIFLEPRWEMDRKNLASTVGSPAQFIAGWDRIRSIFAAEHVSNVSWVWCPTAAGFAIGRAQPYYPGDAMVDWVCADAYPSATSKTEQSFAETVQAFMAWAKHHPKPVMIGEFGVPRTYGDRRAAWLTAAAAYVRSVPQIKALIYFEGPAIAKHPVFDYLLQNDTAAMNAFATIAREPYFSGAG